MADIQNETSPLSGTEYSMVGPAVFNKLAEYKADIPLHFDYQSMDGPGHVGFMTVPGGKYLSRDICGGFVAQLPFQIMYETTATTNKELLQAEATISEIAEYIETKPYPELDGGREITKIQADGIPYRAQAENSGTVMFLQTGTIIYEKG